MRGFTVIRSRYIGKQRGYSGAISECVDADFYKLLKTSRNVQFRRGFTVIYIGNQLNFPWYSGAIAR